MLAGFERFHWNGGRIKIWAKSSSISSVSPADVDTIEILDNGAKRVAPRNPLVGYEISARK